MEERKFLGTILIHSPKLFPILEGIIDKYDIPEIEPANDGIRERLLAELEAENEIDWEAVKADLDTEIRNIPDLLPPELQYMHNLLEGKDTLKLEPEFTEPITKKLREDVTNLYHMYVNLYISYANTIAMPFKGAIDNYFSGLVEVSYEYLYTGKVREIPMDWVSAVGTFLMFDTKIVIALATSAVDPDEITQAFHQELTNTFIQRKPRLTKENLPFAEYLAMKLRKVTLKDIADEYILRHPREFPKNPNSPEYKRKKRVLKSRLKMTIRRLGMTADNLLGNTK
ncbi:MAG: hypothetical protein H6634_00035 [Anaerolineales bacterium]|nr:hypothetical protein [Anaerolineales bacterium]